MNNAIVAAIVTGMVVIVLNGLIAAVAYGKMTGAVTTAVTSLSQRVERHEALTDRKFDDIRDDQREQWERLNEHGEHLAYLKAKANGRAAGSVS